MCAIIKGYGNHFLEDGTKIKCEIKLTAYAGKPWIEIAYRIFNTTYEPLHLASLTFSFNAPDGLAALGHAWLLLTMQLIMI